MAESFTDTWLAVDNRKRATVRLGLRHADRQSQPDVNSDPPLDADAVEDARLAVRATAGESAAFDRLVDRYSNRIFAHVFRIVRDREEAEDLTQEIFLRTYRSLARFNPSRPFKSWIYKIATNAGLNALRSRQRRGVKVSLDAHHELIDHQAESPRRELRDELAHAMEGLAPQPAMLIHLHYQEGMSIREAADIVGMNEGSAKVALHRARKRLRELIVETRREEL
jgi:RNA polymerase sigma-70 factor (ECF subfamily)